MTHQKFGNTDLVMPRVVFGATCLGNLFVAMSDGQKRDLIREWFAQIRHRYSVPYQCSS